MGEHVIGPCGEPADVPEIHIRWVKTDNEPMVEIAMLSGTYCWRVRSWWTPSDATVIANRILKAAETDEERDARFAPGNDAIWGEGNWIRCETCPADAEGRAVYHHRAAHTAAEVSQ